MPRRSARLSSLKEEGVGAGDEAPSEGTEERLASTSPPRSAVGRYSLRQRTPRPAATAYTPSLRPSRKKREEDSTRSEPRRRSTRIKTQHEVVEKVKLDFTEGGGLETVKELEEDEGEEEEIKLVEERDQVEDCDIAEEQHETKEQDEDHEMDEEGKQVDVNEKGLDKILSDNDEENLNEMDLTGEVDEVAEKGNKEVLSSDDESPDCVTFTNAKDTALKLFKDELNHVQRRENEIKLQRTLKHELFRLQKEEKYRKSLDKFPQDKLKTLQLSLKKRQNESQNSSKRMKLLSKKKKMKKTPKTLNSTIKKGQKVKVHLPDDEGFVPAGIKSAHQFLHDRLYASNKYKRAPGLYAAARRSKIL